MNLLVAFCLQLTGFYILYSASSRALFVRRALSRWLYTHRNFARLSGCCLLLVSMFIQMINLGIGVGFFFNLVSLMTVSGFMILLLPLQKSRTQTR